MIDEHVNVETSGQVYEVDVGTGSGASVAVALGSAVEIVQGEPFTGAYTVTPSAETQTLATAGLVAQQDITIEPIPSDWGRITWDGSVLTVS